MKMSKITLYCQREVNFTASICGHVETNHACNLVTSEPFVRKNSVNVNIRIEVEKNEAGYAVSGMWREKLGLKDACEICLCTRCQAKKKIMKDIEVARISGNLWTQNVTAKK